MITLNDKAADWWAERLEISEKRVHFRMALKAILDSGEWRKLEVDYDPDDLLRRALVDAVIDVRNALFTSRDILPYKTRLYKRGDKLYGVEGYGAPMIDIETGEPPNYDDGNDGDDDDY